MHAGEPPAGYEGSTRFARRQTTLLHEPDGTWCALLVFAKFGKRPDILFLMSADCTVRELQNLSGAVQTRTQVATWTMLPDITRLAEKHNGFFLVEKLRECNTCVRIRLSIGTVFFFCAARHPADSHRSLQSSLSLAGAWWSVKHSRLSHAFSDRPVCGVWWSHLCPGSKHVRRHGRRSRIAIARLCCKVLSDLLSSRCKCYCCRFTAFSSAVHTWHFGVLTRSAHLPTRSRHGSVNLELLACDIRCC